MTTIERQSHGHDIVVIGASAGGLEPLKVILGALPFDLAATVFVAVHSSTSSILADVLARSAALPVRLAQDGAPIEIGLVYVADADHHLLIKPRHIRVTRGPKENGFRPAIDPLFRSAARSYGPRTIGVILSGALDDGAHGLSLIKYFGGKAIVQDPDEALVPSMPLSACRSAAVDYVVPSPEIAGILARLSREPAEEQLLPREDVMDPDDKLEPDIAEQGSDALANALYPGSPSAFTCPECGGALWELSDGRPVRYRCHVGHGFTADVLLIEQQQTLEIALWAAVRALDENAALCRRMSQRAQEGRLEGLYQVYQDRGVTAQQQANVIRGSG